MNDKKGCLNLDVCRASFAFLFAVNKKRSSSSIYCVNNSCRDALSMQWMVAADADTHTRSNQTQPARLFVNLRRFRSELCGELARRQQLTDSDTRFEFCFAHNRSDEKQLHPLPLACLLSFDRSQLLLALYLSLFVPLILRRKYIVTAEPERQPACQPCRHSDSVLLLPSIFAPHLRTTELSVGHVISRSESRIPGARARLTLPFFSCLSCAPFPFFTF